MKRAQKALETQKVAEEELALLVKSSKVGKKKTGGNTMASPTGRGNKSKNNAGKKCHTMQRNPPQPPPCWPFKKMLHWRHFVGFRIMISL